MAPTRRSNAARPAVPSRQQSTLSFHGKQNKITKRTSPQSGKTSKPDPSLVAEIEHLESKSSVEPASNDEAASQDAIKEDSRSFTEILDDPLRSNGRVFKIEDTVPGRVERKDVGASGSEDSGWIGNEEREARKIPDAQITCYWRQKEQERLAPRVHQGDLPTHEKILREWDMSGQYGPCIGIPRLKRWKRASMLGLKPPIEVLAVLLKEKESGKTKSQRAYVDELMSSHFVEA